MDKLLDFCARRVREVDEKQFAMLPSANVVVYTDIHGTPHCIEEGEMVPRGQVEDMPLWLKAYFQTD